MAEGKHERNPEAIEPRDGEVGEALSAFYADVLYALAETMRSKRATLLGAPKTVKDVALAHGVPVARTMTLPRLTRAELERREDPFTDEI